MRAGYGYGEYCGMDPHVAAKHINALPEDEQSAANALAERIVNV